MYYEYLLLYTNTIRPSSMAPKKWNDSNFQANTVVPRKPAASIRVNPVQQTFWSAVIQDSDFLL